MIKQLIKLANILDKKGFAKEADYLDKMIAKYSGNQGAHRPQEEKKKDIIIYYVDFDWDDMAEPNKKAFYFWSGEPSDFKNKLFDDYCRGKTDIADVEIPIMEEYGIRAWEPWSSPEQKKECYELQNHAMAIEGNNASEAAAKGNNMILEFERNAEKEGKEIKIIDMTDNEAKHSVSFKVIDNKITIK